MSAEAPPLSATAGGTRAAAGAAPGPLRRTPRPRARWPGRVVAALYALGLLGCVFVLHRGGQPLAAVALLAFGTLLAVLYGTAVSVAWKYLFPGIAGMLVFAAFPLVYTVQIGFTNHSSNHLLDEQRVREYLLEQTVVDDARTLGFELHAAPGGAVRLVLASPEAGAAEGAREAMPTAPAARWVTPPLTLRDGAPAQPVALQPLAAGAPAADLGAPLDLRERVRLRPALQRLRLGLPDGSVVVYTGLREFGSALPLWQALPDGGLRRTDSGEVYRADRDTGYFQTDAGEAVQPGFKVFVGASNYQRMLGDPDFRGPFLSIFVWTVVFSGLTVLFSTALGMALAVLLNWEALRGRVVYRTLLFLPYAVPGFISILVFRGLFNQNFGEINAILDALFGIRPAWFADPTLARAMLVLVNTWLGYPYILVLCTGLLKSIPADLYEASALAGAGPWTNFRRITAPLIIGPLTPLLVSAFAFNFNNFVLISLLTDGRPDYLNTKLPAGTTDILVSYTYRIAFTDAGQNFGLAAAISTVIFAMVALMALLQLRLTAARARRA